MRRTALLAAALATGCGTPPPPVVDAAVSCVPLAHALTQLCTVTLTDRATGRRVEGATVTLHADMPSMPLAHSVRPVRAAPTAGGTYAGTLELEMTGRWVVAVRVTGPVNDQFTQTLDIN